MKIRACRKESAGKTIPKPHLLSGDGATLGGKTPLQCSIPSLRCDTRRPIKRIAFHRRSRRSLCCEIGKGGVGDSEGDSCECVPQSWENRTRPVNLASGLSAQRPAEGRSTAALGGSLGVRVGPARTLRTRASSSLSLPQLCRVSECHFRCVSTC